MGKKPRSKFPARQRYEGSSAGSLSPKTKQAKKAVKNSAKLENEASESKKASKPTPEIPSDFKSVRLSKGVRTTILYKVLAHRFTVLQQELRDREQALAVRCYEYKYDEKERKAMTEAPEHWLPSIRQLEASFGLCLHLQLPEDSRLRVPSCHYQPGYRELCVRIPATEELSKDLYKYSRDKDALRVKYREVEDLTRKTLDSFASTGALVLAWPEIVSFVPAPVEKKAPSLPMVVLSKLNEHLDLPPDESDGPPATPKPAPYHEADYQEDDEED